MSRVLVVFRDEDEVESYLEAAAEAGIDCVPGKIGELPALDSVAGVLLTGGTDVDPKQYNEPPHPATEAPDSERDEAERALIREALDRDMPVLAICRGLQILNVALGGKLIQHLETVKRHAQPDGDRSAAAHNVSIEPGTLLHSIAQSAEWQVNSRHHQAIRDLGRGLRASARDPFDDTIEAVELPGKKFVLGVQWHPENMALKDTNQLRLFQRFANS